MYKIQEENNIDAVNDCLALAKAHYYEVEAKSESIPFNLDLNAFDSLIKSGMLSLVVARKDGVAVGYMANLVVSDIMTSVKSASELGIYLDPSVRGGKMFIKLLRASQEALEVKGVRQHLIMFKAGHDTGMAEKLGYKHTETTYMKLLGEDNGSS